MAIFFDIAGADILRVIELGGTGIGDELHLVGLVEAVDVASERPRLTKLVEEKRRAVDGYRRKLDNRGYVDNAPPAVVEETRERMAQAEADLVSAERALAALDGASS